MYEVVYSERRLTGWNPNLKHARSTGVSEFETSTLGDTGQYCERSVCSNLSWSGQGRGRNFACQVCSPPLNSAMNPACSKS